MGPINIVLDIDGVLTCQDASTAQHANFFLKKGAIITALKTHYIFPGIKELINLLFHTKQIKVSFFSAGDKTRNDVFVKKLLKLSLDKETYKKIKNDVLVLSRDHLVIQKKDQNVPIQLEDYKKDITKALQASDNLENAILIDDNDMYVAKGQEKNWLRVPSTLGLDIEKLEEKAQSNHFNQEGYKKIPCVIQQSTRAELRTHEKESVLSLRRIIIFRTSQEYEIGFNNHRTHKYDQKTIPASDELNESFNKIPLKEFQTNTIQDTFLLEKIYQFVTNHDGKTTKICRRANRVYYITGLLFKALEISQIKKAPISDVMCRLQFNKKHEVFHFHPCFIKSSHFDEYYEYGLEKLRQINRELNFTTPYNYMECIRLPLSDEEKEFLEEAIYK